MSIEELMKRSKGFMRKCYSLEDIKQASSLIEKCVEWAPEKRIKARDALQHSFFISIQ